MQTMISDKKIFNYIPMQLLNGGQKTLFSHVMQVVLSSRIESIAEFKYEAADDEWTVFDGDFFKMTLNKSHTYHCFFSKADGLNIRFGKTLDDDPVMCKLGPEIADIEIVIGSCPKVSTENCRWCYKNNTSAPGKVMTLEQFKTVVDKFPKNLSQIALGITGVKSNPYLKEILKWIREQGMIGNLTLTGADLDDEMSDVLCQYCGACAVSCYDKAKSLCYTTIKRLNDNAKEKFKRDMHINMHVVIADFSMGHVMDVLNDIKEGKVPGLKSVIFLHAKPVGRAMHLDCSLSKENLEKVIKFCLDNSISFGFDSCNGVNVQNILKELDKDSLCSSIEPCESSLMSIYINVDGKMFPCSFVENSYKGAADLLNGDCLVKDIWMNDSVLASFRSCSRCSKSCPAYDLDCR